MTEPVATILRKMTAKRSLPPPQLRRAIRQSSGLSAAEVAQAMGVTRQALARWERGEREPREPLLSQYVAVLDAMASRP